MVTVILCLPIGFVAVQLPRRSIFALCLVAEADCRCELSGRLMRGDLGARGICWKKGSSDEWYFLEQSTKGRLRCDPKFFSAGEHFAIESFFFAFLGIKTSFWLTDMPDSSVRSNFLFALVLVVLYFCLLKVCSTGQSSLERFFSNTHRLFYFYSFGFLQSIAGSRSRSRTLECPAVENVRTRSGFRRGMSVKRIPGMTTRTTAIAHGVSIRRRLDGKDAGAWGAAYAYRDSTRFQSLLP